MSLRIITDSTQIQNWIAERQGVPARQRSGDTLSILFGNDGGDCERLSLDELIEAMKSQHFVLLVEQEPGKTFHKFVVRA